MKSNPLKRILAIMLIVVIVFGMQGCQIVGNFFESGLSADVNYKKDRKYYCSAYGLSLEGKEKEIVYIIDKYKDLRVDSLGKPGVWADKGADFSGGKVKRLYFPWSINRLFGDIVYGNSLEYVICPSVSKIPAYSDGYGVGYGPDPVYKNIKFVLSNYAYKDVEYDYTLGDIYSYVDEKFFDENCIPANISYVFNYERSLNKGYFFIDLLERTGRLTEPPYDPERFGHVFAGWYTDPECTDKWDFEKDIVIIEFDDEGKRIYEEVFLYAKWDKK